jgi:peptide/nickel transport system permease protein
MSSPAATALRRRMWRRDAGAPPAFAAMRGAWRYGRTRLGIAITLAVVVLALIGPALAPHTTSDLVAAPFSLPQEGAPLGTDYLGHDVLTQVLYGGRSIVWMSFAAATLGVAAGVALGLIAGYSRSLADDAIMRTLDVVYAFPHIVLVLLFVAMLGNALSLIVVLVAVAWVPGVARVTRGITTEVVTREYVQAAEVIGVPRRRILAREVLPNVMTPVLVELGLRITWSIGLIAAISFLGFGVQPPDTDWGLMINQNRNGLSIQPWAVAVPVVLIAVFTVGTNLIAEGLARSIAGIDRQVKDA